MGLYIHIKVSKEYMHQFIHKQKILLVAVLYIFHCSEIDNMVEIFLHLFWLWVLKNLQIFCGANSVQFT